jgi:OmpA-OmpF porin, OOP family
MNFDILESLNSALGGPVTRQLSASLGESEDSTRSAVRSIGPTMLAGLMQQATTPSGAADIFRAVNNDRIDPGIVGKLGSILGNRGAADSLLGIGESLAGAVFGNRSGALTNALSQVTGVRPNSALSLLSMGLPLLFGMLRKQVTNNALDSSGLASLLFSQRKALEKTGLDSRITNALGFSSLSSLLGAVPGVGPAQAAATRQGAPIRDRERQRSAWLPWAIAASVAALGLLLLFNRTADRTGVETAQTAPAPGAARSTRVYFDSGETTVDGEDRLKIASLAQSARGQDRPVAVTGYTDRSGDRDQNLEIAKDRATAVREALVAEGVAESKIVMDPPAEVTGTGTEAEARRVDIEVR